MTSDRTVEARGLFTDLATEWRCVEQVIAGHGGWWARGSRALPAERRRSVPLRWLFDEPVGMVHTRDGASVPGRIASVVVEVSVEGRSRVVVAHPELPLPPAPSLPVLEVLFGSYFHQEWRLRQDDPLDVVAAFRGDSDDATLECAGRELATLAGSGSELTRRTFVRGLGSTFVPRPEGQLDEFLAHAARLLAV
jgi:hypothetical protein